MRSSPITRRKAGCAVTPPLEKGCGRGWGAKPIMCAGAGGARKYAPAETRSVAFGVKNQWNSNSKSAKLKIEPPDHPAAASFQLAVNRQVGNLPPQPKLDGNHRKDIPMPKMFRCLLLGLLALPWVIPGQA